MQPPLVRFLTSSLKSLKSSGTGTITAPGDLLEMQVLGPEET